MNQENAYSTGCKAKYLLKSKTSVDLVEFNSQSQHSFKRRDNPCLDVHCFTMEPYSPSYSLLVEFVMGLIFITHCLER